MLVHSVISATLFPINSLRAVESFLIVASVHFKSDVSDFWNLNPHPFMIALASHTPKTADCISTHGIVILSNGVTRALAATSCGVYSPDTKTDVTEFRHAGCQVSEMKFY